MTRLILVVVALLFLYPSSVGAVLATCGQTWSEHCDLYTGDCFTTVTGQTWAATLNGVPQPQCVEDPTACWLARAQACGTVPAPVNPAALRACPSLADCGVSPYNPWNLPAAARPPLGQVWECAFIDVPQVEEYTDAMTCAAFLTLPPSQTSGDPRFAHLIGRAFMFGDINGHVFEPPPTCGWVIAPAPPAVACLMLVSPMIAAMKTDSATQWTGLKHYYERLNKRIDVKGWALANGLYGSPATRRYQAQVARIAWMIDLASLIVQLVADPPNPNYHMLPGPGFYPPLTPLTPDATLTQAQINAIQAWLATLRAAVITGRQLTDTIDNLAGALIAAEASAPGAATWVRNLAVHADTALATLATQGLAEIAARAAVVSAGPTVQEPAACSTPTDAVNFLQQAVLGGSTLYQGHLTYREHLGSCGDAATDPAWMASDAVEDAALWNSFSGFSIAAYLCGANPAYCAAPPPSITVTSPNGGGTLTTGQVTNITWTSTGFSGNVIIKLARDGVNYTELLHASAPNTGSYAWTVTGPFTTSARFRVKGVNAPSAVDASNGTTTINGLIVLTPNGGQVYPIGSVQTMTWQSSGCVGPVWIEVGRSGVWTTLNATVPNTGTKNWIVPGPASAQGRVRIRCNANSLLIDKSDAVFTIQ